VTDELKPRLVAAGSPATVIAVRLVFVEKEIRAMTALTRRLVAEELAVEPDGAARWWWRARIRGRRLRRLRSRRLGCERRPVRSRLLRGWSAPPRSITVAGRFVLKELRVGRWFVPGCRGAGLLLPVPPGQFLVTRVPAGVIGIR
jgi:hypothetical protein